MKGCNALVLGGDAFERLGSYTGSWMLGGKKDPILLLGSRGRGVVHHQGKPFAVGRKGRSSLDTAGSLFLTRFQGVFQKVAKENAKIWFRYGKGFRKIQMGFKNDAGSLAFFAVIAEEGVHSEIFAIGFSRISRQGHAIFPDIISQSFPVAGG